MATIPVCENIQGIIVIPVKNYSKCYKLSQSADDMKWYLKNSEDAKLKSRLIKIAFTEIMSQTQFFFFKWRKNAKLKMRQHVQGLKTPN